MRQPVFALLLVASLAGPAAAMSIKGVELSPTDTARVDAQCDALRSRTSGSLIDSSEPPPPGYVVSDPANRWSENADASDAALIRGVDLDAITVRDCRAAGFYDN